MLFKPRSRKFPKAHKGRVSPLPSTSQSLVFGQFGLIALQSSRLTASQLSAAQLALKRKLKRDGVIFLRVFPHIPASHKPAEVRMGKGKGSIAFWYTRISSGSILFELNCSNLALAKLALSVASSKLPFKTAFISRS